MKITGLAEKKWKKKTTRKWRRTEHSSWTALFFLVRPMQAMSPVRDELENNCWLAKKMKCVYYLRKDVLKSLFHLVLLSRYVCLWLLLKNIIFYPRDSLKWRSWASWSVLWKESFIGYVVAISIFTNKKPKW